jgi:hypothetical protein
MIALLMLGLIVFAAVCLWILIEERRQPKFLFWFIPIFLVLVTSIYVTYTSILGYPKFAIPEEGYYLKHYVDEPDWIYLWVVARDRVPRGFRLVYSRKTHEQLEGVKGEAEAGKFMVLGKSAGEEGDEGEGKESAGGYTVGGDINFYEWDHESMMPSKDE